MSTQKKASRKSRKSKTSKQLPPAKLPSKEPFPGFEVARSIGRASALWKWDCLLASVQQRGSRNGLAMFDALPDWPSHYHGRLAHVAAVVAGIARRSGGWERLDQSSQAPVGSDDSLWGQVRTEQLTSYVGEALAALGIGVSESAAAKLLEAVVKELPRLAWREPVAVEDSRVAWLRGKLRIEPSYAVTSTDLGATWAAYAARSGLQQLPPSSESTRMGRAVRSAFMAEIEHGVIIKSENITHSQAGEIRRCRGWVGLVFADWKGSGFFPVKTLKWIGAG